MISCSGVSARYRGVMRRTIHRFEYSSTKNAKPNAKPSRTLVRSTVQKTSERRTSRNHRTSTKNPDSAVKAKTRPATSATRMMIHRRRPEPGTAVGTRTTMGPVRPFGSMGERRKAYHRSAKQGLRSVPFEVGERVVERGDRNQLQAVIAARAGGPQVALRNQEHRCAGVGGRRDLLLHTVDRDHRAVERDLTRARDRATAREVARRQQIVQAERPHQPG